MVILKLLYNNKNKNKTVFRMAKSVFRPKIVFLFENMENVGKVLTGNKNYFRVPKIIFKKKSFSV